MAQSEKLRDPEWLSASIAHEIRSPLSTIYAAAELLKDYDPSPATVKRLALNIHRSACHMRDLLAEFTTAGRENAAIAEKCSVRDVIAAATRTASASTGRDGVQIVVNVPSEIELPLVRSRMERVFCNLITNSLEAMPAGGELRITARIANTCVLVELEDTGPGIPRAIRDRLFEPFVTAGKENGMGLGLALSRKTVRDHGGDLWTEHGDGARFVVRLLAA